ncbi:hypothetical protein Esti_004895 [Eimeria stiedai]
MQLFSYRCFNKDFQIAFTHAQQLHVTGLSPRAAAAVPSIPAAAGGAKGRAPRAGPPGASPKGRRHEGGEAEEGSAAEVAAAAVLESIVSAGAELLHKRAFDRKCFAFAAADAAYTLLSILNLCHLNVDPGEPGDLLGRAADVECTEGAPLKRVGGGPPLSPDAEERGPRPAPGLEGEATSAEEGRLMGGPPNPAAACRWEGFPLPVPGPQDSWAPGCLGIKRLTPELLQQLEVEDKKRQQQQAAPLKHKPSFSRPAAAAAKAAAARQTRGAKSSPLPRGAAAATAPAASKQGAGSLSRVSGGRGPTKEQRERPQVQRRLSPSSLSGASSK